MALGSSLYVVRLALTAKLDGPADAVMLGAESLDFGQGVTPRVTFPDAFTVRSYSAISRPRQAVKLGVAVVVFQAVHKSPLARSVALSRSSFASTAALISRFPGGTDKFAWGSLGELRFRPSQVGVSWGWF